MERYIGMRRIEEHEKLTIDGYMDLFEIKQRCEIVIKVITGDLLEEIEKYTEWPSEYRENEIMYKWGKLESVTYTLTGSDTERQMPVMQALAKTGIADWLFLEEGRREVA